MTKIIVSNIFKYSHIVWTFLISGTIKLLIFIAATIAVILFLLILWDIHNRLVINAAQTFYLPLLNTAIDDAYNILYKNHLRVYELSKVSIDPQNLRQLERQFIELVFTQVGTLPKLMLILLFGSLDSVHWYLLVQFRERVDSLFTSTSNTTK